MIIAIIILLFVSALLIAFAENTKTGKKLADYIIKQLLK